MELTDQLYAPRGELNVRALRDGVEVLRWGGDNLVVNSSKDVLARLVAGVVTAKPLKYIGFGTGAQSASPADHALTDAVYVQLMPPVFPAPGLVRFPFEFAEDQANGMVIREFGLFAADYSMFARKVRSQPILKTDLALVGEWEVYF